MTKKSAGWLNLENGAFIGSMLLMGWVVISYIRSEPAPIVLEPAHYEASEVLKSRKKRVFEPESFFAGADPLVPGQLSKVMAYTVRPKKVPKFDPGKWKLPDLTKLIKKPSTGDAMVNLPPKKSAKKAEPQQQVKTKEPPFPLRLIGILKPKGGSGRIVIVATPDGQYQHLTAGDEWRVGEESVRVVSISPTWVVFERENGKKVKLSNDPMTSWKGAGGGDDKTKATPPASKADKADAEVKIPADVKKMLEAAGVKIPPNLTQKDVDAFLKKMPGGAKNLEALKSLMGKNMSKGLSPKELDKLLKSTKGANSGMMEKLKDFF